MSKQLEALLQVLADEQLVQLARRAIDKAAFDMRDNRTSVIDIATGVVHNERDGRSSNIIRLSNRDAFVIGLSAIVKRLQQEKSDGNLDA